MLLSAASPAAAAWRKPVEARYGIVASASPHATEAGQAMLAIGGSAVDAAVAVSFALSVTEPWSSGIGGGGFMVIHAGGKTSTWDFRETAPAAATRDMYVGPDGKVVRGESTWSPRAAGIPGQVRGLVAVHAAHGRLPLEVVMAPAISLADDGFRVSPRFARRAGGGSIHMDAAARAIFLQPDGTPPAVDSMFRQPALAATLRAIARTRGEDFYTGGVAREMVRGVREAGGLWTLEDLAGYQVKQRPPIEGTYRGFGVASMGPPSSGGVLLVQMLGVLESFDLKASGWGSAETTHLLAEAMKRAFAMRATGLGDPDFYEVDHQRFYGPATIERLRAEVKAADNATPADRISKMKVRADESTHTSHFGVLLANGDAVGCTQTVNLGFGSGRMAGDTGVVLNNEMDDFAAAPGVPNAFGLVGDEANSVAPGKRPLSSMTPTLLIRDGKAVGVFGSPGGSRIITTTLQSILNVVDHQMNVAQAIGAPRVHHQWFPDELRVEAHGMSPDTKALLESLGHVVRQRGMMGNAMALWRLESGVLTGAADPRGEGTAAGVLAP